jgi:Tfp pilus assembly protein PilN
MAVAVGVELHPSAVRAVVVDRAGGRTKLLAAQEVACETSNAELLTRALSDLRYRLRINRPIVLGLPGTSAILTTVRPLIASPERAALAVQFELQQHLPFDLRDAVWHFRWLVAPIDGQHRASAVRQQPTAVAAAVRRSALEERLSACKRAGLSVAMLGVGPLAVLSAWALHRAASGSLPPSTLIRVEDQAAEWIIWTGVSLQVVPVASPTRDALVPQITASWEALRAQGLMVPSPVWVIGGLEAVPLVQQALTVQPGVVVDRFDPAQVVVSSSGRWERPDHGVVALGLALEGAGPTRFTLNLLDRAQREAKAERVRRSATATSGLALAATLVFGAGGMLAERQRWVRVLEAVERQERVYQGLRPEVRALLQRQEHTEHRSRQLESLISGGSALTAALARIAETLPETSWLVNLELSKDGILTGLVEGRATSFQDVTQFMDRLKTSGSMTTVKPVATTVTTDETTKQELIAFTVQVQRPLTP